MQIPKCFEDLSQKHKLIVISAVAVVVMVFGTFILDLIEGGPQSRSSEELSSSNISSKNLKPGAGLINVRLVSGKEKSFVEAFYTFSDLLIDTNRLSAQTLSYPQFLKLLSGTHGSFGANDIVVFSPDIVPSNDELLLLELKKVPSVFFSYLASDLCLEKDEETRSPSKYAWNLDVVSHSYVEAFLSLINERHGKLGYDLPIVVYVNKDRRLIEQGKVFAQAIKNLGFVLVGPIAVDDRLNDVYQTLRRLFDYRARAFIGVMSPRGKKPFYPTAEKLGFSFEMGMADVSPENPEDIPSYGRAAEGVLVPMPYMESIPSHTNKAFVGALKSKNISVNLRTFRSYLTYKFIDLILSGMKESQGELSSAIRLIDGKRFEGPSGLVTVYEDARGLIQPMYVAEVKKGKYELVQTLGDMTLASDVICK